MSSFEKIRGRLGFGAMRLPLTETEEKEIDTEAFSRMVDAFMAGGFNYFDTAHGYHRGKSEGALKTSLTSRYPRESYVLTDKLSGPFFKREEEIRPLFESQLAACGVDYFDFYLMHAQDRENFKKFKECRAYETALQLKAEGKIRHFGISFHDNAEMLEQILTEYPQIEVVQIQFNYMDYEDVSVDSRRVYETCRRFGKPILVMEPVKGGCLVRLPDTAKAVFDGLGGGSYASYAIRFAAGFDGVIAVLSGMGDMDMVKDNMETMRSFRPLDEAEWNAVGKVSAILRGEDMISCTACRYCVDGCPMGIPIPELFACMNTKKIFNNWNAGYYYDIHTHEGGKASTCIGCGACESACPQHLPIRKLLSDVADAFEKKEK